MSDGRMTGRPWSGLRRSRVGNDTVSAGNTRATAVSPNPAAPSSFNTNSSTGKLSGARKVQMMTRVRGANGGVRNVQPGQPLFLRSKLRGSLSKLCTFQARHRGGGIPQHRVAGRGQSGRAGTLVVSSPSARFVQASNPMDRKASAATRSCSRAAIRPPARRSREPCSSLVLAAANGSDS